MRILLLSDIHANWTALQAVLNAEAAFDACLVLGDLVEFGPEPHEVVQWVRQNATAAVRGNHDHSVAEFMKPQRDDTPWHQLRNQMRYVQWQKLTAMDLHYLRNLPLRKELKLDSLQFQLIHASPRDPLNEYLDDDPAVWNRRAGDVQGDFLCVGHTHRPLILQLKQIQLINPGSVGQQKEGGFFAAYAIIENGVPELKTVAYPAAELLEAFRRAGASAKTIQLAERIYEHGFTMED
ncbi:MAG: metallophosphoesterase family protein [Planctomycetaceae bacterium]|nr:metallophosphoesterase family protein [Planctomycetaceae bacterium]